jgi:hypothetical protein
LFAGFGGNDSLFKLDPNIFSRNLNFASDPGAAVRVK